MLDVGGDQRIEAHHTLEEQVPVTVPTLTLASFLERIGVDRGDLLGLDVAGAVHPGLIGQDAEASCGQRLHAFDVELLPRPGLEATAERLATAGRRTGA